MSFLRDCQDKPVVSMGLGWNGRSTDRQIASGAKIKFTHLQILNGVKTDASFRTYYRSCQQNLCNGHNGRVYNSSGGGGGSGGAGGSVGGNHNAIIPGKNGCLGAGADILWLLPMLLLLLLCDCN